MTKTLKVPYFNENESFDGAAVAEINEFTWGGDYQPPARAKIFHTEDAFYIRMESEEKASNLRIVESGITEDACDDSCLEFFIMPYPEKDRRYFNFEFTLSGAIYLGVGHDRYDNVLLKETDLSQFDICTYMTNEKGIAKWRVEAKIPYKFLRETLGIDIPFSDGQEMLANFYKCGGKCNERHHGTWNVVEVDDADFHLPEFFGKLYIDYGVKKKMNSAQK